jgi:hypothetical protein
MDVITPHINADFDTIGAMVAARKLYPDAVPVLPGAKEEMVVRRQKEWQFPEPELRYGFPPSGPCG